MLSWHATDCQFPDVSFWENINGALDVPCCSSCGNIGVLEHNSSGDAIGTIREAPSHANLNLSWPSCLPFVEEPAENGAQFDTAISGLIIHGRDTADQTAVTAGSAATHSQGYPAPDTSGFSYDHLSGRKVRLIELLPGNYHDRLRCELTTYDLRHRKPDYEAVSYTWADEYGDTSMKQKLYVGKHYSILTITTNCANALRRLRYPKDGARRHLWIDAVCIDQRNVHERSHQVGMMRDIYTMAKRVLIYIGEDPDDPEPNTSVPWMDRTKRNIEVCSDLAQRAYFTRMWVVQEVASAKTAWILYGSRGFVWKDIDDPDVYTHPNYELLTNLHPWLQLAIQLKYWGMDELLTVMLSTTRCQSTDPRDKVFALLGLLTGTRELGLIPDYTLTRAQVFAGLTAYFLTENTASWWRLFAICRPSSSQDMPTWAVDWASDWTELTTRCDNVIQNSEVYLDPTANGKQENEARRIAASDNSDPLGLNGAQIIRPAQENGFIRFQRDGCFIVKGFSPYSLAECLIDWPATSKPSGVITGVDYMPSVPASEREARLAAIPWARKEDKVFVVAGLPNHLLILRPNADSTKHTYVGICDPPRLGLDNHRLAYLNEQAVLLVSAWNTIVGNVNSQRWLNADFWASIKTVCETILSKGGRFRVIKRKLAREAIKDMIEKWRFFGDEKTDNISSDVTLTPQPSQLSLETQKDLCDDLEDSPRTSTEERMLLEPTKSSGVDSDVPRESIGSAHRKFLIYARWMCTRQRHPCNSDHSIRYSSVQEKFIAHLLASDPEMPACKILLDFETLDMHRILLGHNLDTLSKGLQRLQLEYDKDRYKAGFALFLREKLHLQPDFPQFYYQRFLQKSDQARFYEDYRTDYRTDLTSLENFELLFEEFDNVEEEHYSNSEQATLAPHEIESMEYFWHSLKTFAHATRRLLIPLETLFTNYHSNDKNRLPYRFWAHPPFVAKAKWEDVYIG